MPCSQALTYLSQTEIIDVLKAVGDQGITAAALSEALGLPLFKSRSQLRELEKIGYLSSSGDTFTVTELGYKSLV